MEQKVIELYTKTFGQAPERVEHLFGGGGSSRRYYKMTAADGKSVYGVTSTSPDENESFYRMSLLFRERGLSVPEVYALSEDHSCYLQQNLGTTTLKDFITNHKTPDGNIDAEGVAMLKTVVADLPNVQFRGAGEDVFSKCYPVPALDEMSVMFDLNYFKYCFVKLAGIEFNEVNLQHDFDQLTRDILSEDSNTFLYRDFQARNVMIYENRPYYIDYQGGRRGPIYYDVASFLWQASAGYSDELRQELIDVYLEVLQPYRPTTKDEFMPRLMLFVLFRTLQVLGAYGFRGLWEKKQHFIDSIPAGLNNLKALVEAGVVDDYPYLKKVCGILIETLSQGKENIPDTSKKRITEETKENVNAKKLTVQVSSFSFKKGIPVDESGNGGGYVFDCRGTNNPGRYEEYKRLTGLDQPVIDFLEKDGEILNFLNSVYPLVDFHAKRFVDRGFTHLMISFGCTGGQHRSVYCAQHVAEHLHQKFGVRVELCHREQKINQTME